MSLLNPLRISLLARLARRTSSQVKERRLLAQPLEQLRELNIDEIHTPRLGMVTPPGSAH